MINIKLILRLKEENKSAIEIEQFLLNPSTLVQILLKKESTEQVVKELHKHKITELKGEEEDLMEKLEMDLSIYLLKKESLLMHQYMLSANFILGYLFAKEIEVKNLKTLLKGKKLGLDDNYIEKLLVFGK